MSTIDIYKVYLDLANIAYGGILYNQLDDNYVCADILLPGSNIEKKYDSQDSSYFSYKNLESGFVACVFRNTTTNELVISFRGTERVGLGENQSSYSTWAQDMLTDVKIVNGITDQQFIDAWNFYSQVKNNTTSGTKIILTGHSLGGALAQFVAAKEFNENSAILETYTYNAPGIKNILDANNINSLINYSFIKNYSVMNDWCGMFGEQVGTSYLIQPIPLKKIQDINDIGMEGIKKLFCASHEGIFDYSAEIHGEIIEKPDDFRQEEGLSLWYYDKNNIIKDFQSLAEFASILNKVSALLTNTIISYLENVVAQVSYNGLKDAIDIIHREYNVPINQLHYVGNIGDYIIGTNNNDIRSDYYKGSSTFLFLGGNDIIWGHGGNDSIYGLSGNDILIGDSTTLKVRELEELRDNFDSIKSNPISLDITKFESENDGNDNIYGGKGDDIIFAGGGNDYISGGKNSDIIYGGNGDDTIIGEENNDVLIGGLGYDTYIINSGDGVDTIYDSSLIQNTDGLGHINFNGNILHGSIMKNPIAGIMWIDSFGNWYLWNGNEGSDLIINGTTTVKSFENGETLEIYLGKYNEPIPVDFQEYTETMKPVPKLTINPEQSPLADKIKEMYPDLFPKYKEAIKSDGIVSDPIILDLDGNGIDIANNSVYFDYAGDGFAEATAWVSGNDGILVTDTNNNGVIDNATELLLHNTLENFDSNNDGIINSNDENVSQLKILKADGTLQSLQDAGIEFISLNTQNVNYVDEYGNTQFMQGSFGKTDGSVNEYGEFTLQTDTSNAFEKNEIDVSSEIKELPEIRNMGKSSSLQQAMMKDESGNLKTLVQSFVSETNDTNRMNLVDQILEKWANVSDVENGSRGNFIDAKKLAIIETFMGTNFVSAHENEENPQNPNIEAAELLNTLYEQLKMYVYAELISQTHLSDLVKNISIQFSEDGSLKIDLSNVVSILSAEMETNTDSARQRVYEFVKFLKGFGYDTKSNFFDPKDDSCFYTTFTKDDRELKWLIDSIGKVRFEDELGFGEGSAADDAFRLNLSGSFHALSGDDVIYGSYEDDAFSGCSGDDIVDAGAGNDTIFTQSGRDLIYAGDGNDTIIAGEDDDIILGGNGDDLIYPDNETSFSPTRTNDDIIRGEKGNDTVISLRGNDTYLFFPGDGQDTIIEKQGVDTCYFGGGITWDDLTFSQQGNDMVISILNSTDKITVKDWFVSDEDGVYRYDNNKIEIFEFDDGSIHYKDEITVGDNSEPVKYIMNEMGNEIELASNYKTEVILKSGYNNIIAGQNSDDVYILNNQGTDAYISDYSGDNIVKFNPSISLAHTFFAADENGIEVWFDNFDSHLLIRGDNFSFEFADNSTVYDLHDLLIKDVSYSDYTMGEKLQELKLLGYDSASITGNNLDNLIINGYGSYVIEANGGNDIIESIFGSYDTYKYNIGDGVDTITDIGGNDSFVFGEGITQDNVRFIKDLSNNNLEIFFDFDSEANSKIIINNFFEDPKFKIESFVFADNSVISNIEEHLFAISPNKDLNEPFVLAEGVKNIRLKGENHYTVVGNDLNNSIDGNIGNNSYQGGLGNDSYHDFAKSNERYYFNIGDGNDSIDDIGGIDAIIFGEDVSRNSFNVIKNDNDLLINFSNIQNNSIRIIDYFNNDERKIELFKFADSFVIDNITPYIKTVLSDSQNIVLTGTQQNAVLIGTENFAAIGNDLDNNIRGNDGNNTIVGHGGNDIIQDTAGDDTYAYYIGDGFDTITDNAGNDRICFGEGISSQNIIFEKHTNDLLIKFNQIEGSIRVVGYFDENLDNKIEKFEFSDGTFITDISDLIVEVQQPEEQPVSSGQNTQENESSHDSLQSGSIVLEEDASSVTLSGSENSIVLGNNLDNTVTGNSGDNTYALCGGNDLVIDTQGGNDTYIYNINDDNLYIADVNGSDVIKFGPEINPDRLRFERQEDNLYIYRNDSDGHIRISNYFSNDSFKIEKFVFDNGTEITDISNLLSGVAPKENYTFSENSIVRIARMAGTEDISVTGNSRSNIIEGNSGNNTFEGKGGNDTLTDVLGGNDTYIFNIGDGNDTIEDIGGTDTLKFGNSISPEDVVFVRFNSDLHVTFKDIPQNGIVIKDFFSDTTKRIEKFEFSDGTVITDISNKISTIISEDNIVLPNGIKDAVLEGVLDTTVTGNSLDNNIKGNSGNNTYSAGEGNDQIQDEDGGNDIYIYNLGDGNDLIKDTYGNEVIKFGQGISKNNLVFIMHNKDLLINFKNNLGEKIDGSIRIEGYFAEDSRVIEHIEFADGSVISDLSSFVSILAADFDVHNSASYPRIQLWGENDISVFGEYSDELVIGNSGNNRYDLLGGNDTIIDTQGGNDTYIFNSDYENKVIKDIGGNDSIEFGLDILSDDTFFLKGADDLHIYFANNSNSSIIVQDYFSDNNSKIENFEFKNNNSVISDISDIISGIASSDNIVLQNSHTQARLLGDSNASVTGSYNDDKIYGNSGNNTYCAGQGNDRIEDKFGGDDTYIYNLGDGYDYIVDVGGFDSINFGEGISLDNLRFVHKYNNLLVYVDSGNNSGLVEVDNHYRYDSRKIEQIKFSNNSVLSDFSSLLSGITINDDYSIDENADISEVYLQGTNDISVSGNSANCYFEGNSGNNTYEGKGGVDVFYDDQGNDTYIYNIGDGTDYITDNSGIDSISFGTGISLNNVIFRHQSDDLSNLQINFEGFDGGIIVFDFFANENNKIEKFEFSDGTVITDISPYLPSLPDVESIPSAVQDENYSVDINLLIQEMNSYGVDNDVILNDFQNQNNEDILLAMAS